VGGVWAGEDVASAGREHGANDRAAGLARGVNTPEATPDVSMGAAPTAAALSGIVGAAPKPPSSKP